MTVPLYRSESVMMHCFLSVGLLFTMFSGATLACPFCRAPSITMSERKAQSDVMLFVRRDSQKEKTKKEQGTTTFEILQIAKQDNPFVSKDSNKTSLPFSQNKSVTLKKNYIGKQGDLFLLFGNYEEDKNLKGKINLTWGDPVECTETAFHYVIQSPSPEVATRKRLLFFIKFLEFHDPIVANDAFNEFAKADYYDIVSLTDKLPREKIRSWLISKETPSTRLGLFGMMLGLCGNKADIERMEKIIVKPAGQELRLGIDGIIGGYLLLTGSQGLAFIEKHKFQDKDCPFSETFSAMKALRFIWTYGDGRISKTELKESMRKLVNEPRLADLAIADLARWKDWEIQDQLRKLYDKNDYQEEQLAAVIRLAIIRYMLASTIDEKTNSEKDLPPHVIKGKRYLDEFEKLDPKTMRRARHFFSPG